MSSGVINHCFSDLGLDGLFCSGRYSRKNVSIKRLAFELAANILVYQAEMVDQSVRGIDPIWHVPHQICRYCVQTLEFRR